MDKASPKVAAPERFQCLETTACEKCAHKKSHAVARAGSPHLWVVCNYHPDPARALAPDEVEALDERMGETCSDCGHTCGEATHKCDGYAQHVADLIAERAEDKEV